MEEKKKGNPKTAHSLNQYGKGNKFRTQYQIVYQSFKEHHKTMLDVSLETGIFVAMWLTWKKKDLFSCFTSRRMNIRKLKPDITLQIKPFFAKVTIISQNYGRLNNGRS